MKRKKRKADQKTGYNCSPFAYSVVGYGAIVPVFCDTIFKKIKASEESADYDKENDDCEVQFSMIEIYDEQVKDLLNIKSNGDILVRNLKTKIV
jgi:kinesin family protein 1